MIRYPYSKIIIINLGYIISLFRAVCYADSEQPLLKAPWRGIAQITQGNSGSESHHYHEDGNWDNTYAIDVFLPIGSDVLAPADGVIILKWVDENPSGSGGKELVLEHTGPTGMTFFTVYLHLDEIIIKSGTVRQGEVIAKSGATGNVTRPHLHFHMWSQLRSPDSHTIRIERLLMKNIKTDNDFREYDARNGELDDIKIAAQSFESNQPIPIIISSIRLSQSPPYSIGQTITGMFSIENKGGSPVTFDVLTIGGRLNIDGNVKDFSWHRNIILNPNQSYNYQESLTVSEPGHYWFFPAYSLQLPHWRIGDHSHNDIDVDPNVENQLDITVGPATGSDSDSDLDVGGGLPGDNEPSTPTTPTSLSAGSPFRPLEATILPYSYDLLGKQNIAFSSGQYGSGNTDIYAFCLDRGYFLQITNDNATEGTPAWSPDGTKLAFTSDRDGGTLYVYVRDLLSGEEKRIPNTEKAGHPSWSPDSQRLVFWASRDVLEGNSEIYAVNIDGSELNRLTEDKSPGDIWWSDIWPAWSPKGDLIAYESQWKGASFNNIWLMNPNGGDKGELLTTYTERRQPSWSPDGSKIAYLNGNEVRIVNIDGTDDHSIRTNGPANYPAWSPDGSEIAFTSSYNKQSGVYIIMADGSEPERFVIPGALNPAWSPIIKKPQIMDEQIGAKNPEENSRTEQATNPNETPIAPPTDSSIESTTPPSTAPPTRIIQPDSTKRLPYDSTFENSVLPPSSAIDSMKADIVEVPDSTITGKNIADSSMAKGGVNIAIPPEGLISLDFNPADGDQTQNAIDDAVVGRDYTLQLHIRDFQGLRGWGVTLSYDPHQVRYTSNTLQKINPVNLFSLLHDDGQGTISIVGTISVSDSVSWKNWALGDISFRTTTAFTGNTAIIITENYFHYKNSEIKNYLVHFSATINSNPGECDFNGDDVINLDDFFLFADHFGKTDPLYDLDRNGRVDLADFFLFAEHFTGQARAKLLNLAQERFRLVLPTHIEGNYPNPFNTSTTIRINLAEAGIIQLSVFNLAGQKVKSLVNAFQEPGIYRAIWDGTDERGELVSSGVYLARLQAEDFNQVQKVVLIK